MNHECVYGGTFDPFHNGHEAICLHVLAETEARGVPLRIIPCAKPALKQQAQASDVERLAMLNCWRHSQKNASRIIVDAIEVEQGSVSYTEDTMNRLQQLDKKPTLRVWVMGVDAFNSLSRWHNAAALIRLLSFWVISRPGEADLTNPLELKEANSQAELWQRGAGHFWFDDRLAFSEASSGIRQAIDQKPLPVPQAIADYIDKHELYQATA